MNRQELRELFEEVRSGVVTVDEAISKLRIEPLADLGFAKVDQHRQLRCGFPEVIYAEGKTADQVLAVFSKLVEAHGRCLATRVTAEQATRLLERFSSGNYDPVGRTFWYGVPPETKLGRVVVITAGTSDLPVASEAETTARVMGCETELIGDVGVAGLHRLLRYEPSFANADSIVVTAGMEGALPSVVGGLVDCPVIAVPTSVGYGASFGGVAALLGMLSSCAANVAVVNIDAGFCGGYVAAVIARRAAAGRSGK
jgi:NCAIR mutase (PurE)-related protein